MQPYVKLLWPLVVAWRKAAATVTTVTARFRYYFTGFAAGRCAKYCDEHVCLYLRLHISKTTPSTFTKKNLAMTMTIALGDLVQTVSSVLTYVYDFRSISGVGIWWNPMQIRRRFYLQKSSQTTTIAISNPNNIDFNSLIKRSRSSRNGSWDTSTLTSVALHSYAVASPTKLTRTHQEMR